MCNLVTAGIMLCSLLNNMWIQIWWNQFLLIFWKKSFITDLELNFKGKPMYTFLAKSRWGGQYLSERLFASKII